MIPKYVLMLSAKNKKKIYLITNYTNSNFIKRKRVHNGNKCDIKYHVCLSQNLRSAFYL